MAYEGHLFFENVQNLMQISKMQWKIEKNSFIFKILVSELVEFICLYEEENTCHRQSMF